MSLELEAQPSVDRVKLKAEPEAKKRKSMEEENSKETPSFYELGGRKRVSVSEFKGKLLVDIREYYEDKADGSMKPGKKGISLTMEQWESLKGCIDGVDRIVQKQK